MSADKLERTKWMQIGNILSRKMRPDTRWVRCVNGASAHCSDIRIMCIITLLDKRNGIRRYTIARVYLFLTPSQPPSPPPTLSAFVFHFWVHEFDGLKI